MQPEPCPTAADYDAMLHGRLADDRAAAVEAHVGTCRACQALLDGLLVDPRLTDALRSGPSELPDAPDLSAMVSRIEEMASQFTPAGFDPSAAGDRDETAADPPRDPREIGRLGPYRVVRLLGAGGMGLVYLAEDELLHRRVAVKMLPPRLARRPAAREGFLREARAMAALKHDNVVTVFQVGEAAGTDGDTVPYLAMELLEGESLSDCLRHEGRVPAVAAARLGAQAAAALAAAHAAGVVHRDVKPGNLWLEAPPGWANAPPDARPPLASVARLKVLDFGLARPPGEDPATGGRGQGTPAYMSPEQARGESADARSDVFSLGVVLYELITGRLPFPRTDRKAPPAYPAPPAVRDLAPDAPPALADLILRAISTDPADRPASAAELAAALAAFSEPAPPSRRTVRRRVALAAVAGVILGGVGVAAWATSRWVRHDPAPAAQLRPASESPAPPGPPDDAWCRAVGEFPPERQFAAVKAKLRELNPGYDGQVTRYGQDGGSVNEFGIYTDAVADIRPLRTFRGLKYLTLVGTEPGRGKLTDLSPIRGLPLTVLNVWQNPGLSDVSAVRGMKLTTFQAGDTAIEDLSPFADMPLNLVAVNNCRVRDLSPVRTFAKLGYLRCDGCPIVSLEPLVGRGLERLTYSPDPARNDEEILARAGIPRVSVILSKKEVAPKSGNE